MNSQVVPRLADFLLSRALCSARRPWTRSYPAFRYVPTRSVPGSQTPLARHLTGVIKAAGPITLASYMRQCLTSDFGGYYTTRRPPGYDQFGKGGDFVTSPEVSQVFGELIGIWCVSEWMAQGRVAGGIQIIEFGPGRGTCMYDILRTLQRFREMSRAVEAIYFIEASPSLRETQKNLLCGEDEELVPVGGGHTCMSKFSRTPIIWYEDFSFVPKRTNAFPFIIAHEFFDALPIHAFKRAGTDWRELLVTNAPRAGWTEPKDGVSKLTTGDEPEFVLKLASTPTRESVLLQSISHRYCYTSHPTGSTIEVSLEALTLMEKISQTIGGAGAGAALVIDYGTIDTIPTDSLRGIRGHEFCSPFRQAGAVDLSADVDFTALAEQATNASGGVEVHGPVLQGAFLGMLGAKERVDLLKALVARMGEEAQSRKQQAHREGEFEIMREAESQIARSQEKIAAIDKSYQRLVDGSDGGMGRAYKALAIIPECGGRKPVGFGGSVPWESEKPKKEDDN